MATLFEPIRKRFFRRIEKDKDFFTHYNVSTSDAIALAETQANGYLVDAVDKLTSKCTPDVDFYDYDDILEQFNFDLTNKEIGLLAGLMYEFYFDRDLVTLKAFKIAMTPSDLNQFSPASERKSFTDMLEVIKKDNLTNIDRYASVDRITGKRKAINYGLYSED